MRRNFNDNLEKEEDFYKEKEYEEEEWEDRKKEKH